MSGLEISIRAAMQSDLTGLLDLYRQLNPDDPILAPAEATTIFADMLRHPGMTIFVADREDIIISSVTLIVVPNLTRAGASYALIENVVTHQAHRKQGHAGRLIEAAIQQAWNDNCYKVMLLTGSKDPATLRFYQSCGFAQSKTGFQLRRP